MRRLPVAALQGLCILGAIACQAEPPPAPSQPAPAPAESRPVPSQPAGGPATEQKPAPAPQDGAPAGAYEETPAGTPSEMMLAAVNRERTLAPPLSADPLLAAVVQEYVDDLSRRGVLPSGDVSQRLIDRLNERGYKAYRVVISFAQIGGEFGPAIDRWKRGDRGTFQRLEHPELRDFALGVGAIHDHPLYVAVGAVRQQAHYAAETADLRGDLERLRQDELRRVNARRAESRRAPLQRHPSLDLVAQSYAEDMLKRGFYGHFSPEGEDVSDRVRAARYLYRKVGENIASGQTSVASVMQGWIESHDHLENLLDRDFQEIGIGFAAGPSADGSYSSLWVQVFGQPR